MRSYMMMITLAVAAAPLAAQGRQPPQPVRPRQVAPAPDNAQRERMQAIRQRFAKELQDNRQTMARTRERMRAELQRVMPRGADRPALKNAPMKRRMAPARGRLLNRRGIGARQPRPMRQQMIRRRGRVMQRPGQRGMQVAPQPAMPMTRRGRGMVMPDSAPMLRPPVRPRGGGR